MNTTVVSRLVHSIRAADRQWSRARRPDRRTVVFDAKTAMDYGMMAPVHRRLLADPRVRTFVMSSERPQRTGEIFRDAPPGVAVVPPAVAAMRRFDACLAADLVWATLPRGTRRVQMFHGVAGKWGTIYDRPSNSMRQWDRLFFINRRRMRNFIASGAIDAASTAGRLIGMPKSDCLLDGSLTRDAVLAANGLDPSRQTVIYAPTWTRFSSLNLIGEQLIGALMGAGYQVLLKLHENSLDGTFTNSGGVDWLARLDPIVSRGGGRFIRSSDASPWLVAADVMITDHSSIGFEYLLLDRPLIRIIVPELIDRTEIAPDYVEMLAAASTPVHSVPEVIDAVGQAFADPMRGSDARRAVASELFHSPGRATERALEELYSLIELELPAVPSPRLATAGRLPRYSNAEPLLR
jgi:hypothetical protein